MKTTSKFLTVSAIALTMATSGHAQSDDQYDGYDEYMEEDSDDQWMEEDYDSGFDDENSDYQDTWADPQPQQRSSSDATLPPMGEDVSLDQFDEFYDSLVKEVDDRLGQMKVTSGGEEEVLQGPDVSQNQSDLDEIADSQREIRMLQLKLERAKLAKELWTELSAESIDDLRSNISSLEAELATIEEENAQEVETLRAQNESAMQDLELANAELSAARDEIAALRRERSQALQSAQAAYSASGGQSADPDTQPAGQSGQSNQGASGALSEVPNPRPSALVTNIRLVGGRARAEVSYPGDISANVGIDDVLRDGSRVVSIDRTGVEVSKSGQTYSLDRGSYGRPTGEETDDSSGSSYYDEYSENPEYLDEAAYDANP